MSFLETLADKFFHAFYQKDWPGENESTLDKLSIAEAYEVQDCVAQKRMDVGESVVGYKVGCTSAAIRSQFGLVAGSFQFFTRLAAVFADEGGGFEMFAPDGPT